MSEPELHRLAVGAELALGLLTFVSLFFVSAPYGRHGRAGWGPVVGQRLGWVLMEAPASLLWAAIYLQGQHAWEPAPLALFGLWQLHYLHRAFVFPFRLRAAGKTTPLVVVLLAVAFNTLNAYVNARQVSELGAYPAEWLRDPRFVAGALLFLLGFAVNQHSDHVLMRLRGPGESGYRIPEGGLHRLVASPNYLGEIVEWAGWALATGSVAGLAFAVYTVANLAPRARSHLRWYRETFPDYPRERRALVPFLW